METTYYLASLQDPRYEEPEPTKLIKCELCGDNHEEHKTLVLDNEYGFCYRCIRRGRLHKEVINNYPKEVVTKTLKIINTFILNFIL
jgi:hypothetical protein